MDDNNLIKKTNEVINKQNEMNELISDLKVEVLKTRKENKLLADKNHQLKSQLNAMLEKHDNLNLPKVEPERHVINTGIHYIMVVIGIHTVEA